FEVSNAKQWDGPIHVTNAAYMKWPVHGTAASRVYPSNGYLPNISSIAKMVAFGPFLYAAGGPGEVNPGGWLGKMAIDGSSFATIWSSNVEGGVGVAADPTRAYVSTTRTSDAGLPVGNIYALPNTGGMTKRIGDHGSAGMAADQTDLYYATSIGTL